MTPAELDAWMEQEAAASKRRFAGVPVPEPSRVKREDYPHLQRVGWAFRVADGAAAQVCRGAEHEGVAATVRGVRPVADGGEPALVLELEGPQWWAVRRRDGGTLAPQGPRGDTVPVPEVTVPVFAWPVPGPLEAAVPGPGPDVEDWTVQTVRSEEEP